MPPTKLPSQEEVKAFLSEMEQQTDRGLAIVTAATLDDLLKHVLLARFRELSSERREALFDKPNAALSSFAAKIEMGFAVGAYINNMRLTLHLIRDVRNEFAHSIKQMTFDHPHVAQMIQARAFAPLVKVALTNRSIYTVLVNMAFVVLGVTASAPDMRIKAVEVSHTAYLDTQLGNLMKIVLAAREAKVSVESLLAELQMNKECEDSPRSE